MKYLLDTHYLIWVIADTQKIPRKVRDLIVDRENEILISAISLWEISLKFSLGKLDIYGFSPEDIPSLCNKMGFDLLSLTAKVTSTYHLLEAIHHKDPFDRMLIWEALSNDYVLVSADTNMKKYITSGLKLVGNF